MIDSRPPTTILVTGATGNIGRELLRRLTERDDLHIRAATRDPSGAALPGTVEAVRADLRRADSLRDALTGVTALFLVSQVGDDAAVLAAARDAGVQHVVLVSSITVQSHPHLGPARDNAAVERLLVTSGMDWTILRPTQFASNALWWADSIRESRSVEVPFADIGLPTVDPADIAAVARVALTEPGHRGRRYVLTGPTRISPRRQVDAIAAALGERISCTEIGRARARERMIPQLGPRTTDAVLDVTGGDINEHLLTVRDTVARVTGSPARTFDDWVARNVSVFR